MKRTNDRHVLDAGSLAAMLSAADPDLPVRLLRWHAEQLGTGGPTADGGTIGQLLSEARRRKGIVAWQDNSGKEWVAFEVRIVDSVAEIRLRSDVGHFELVGEGTSWE